MASLSGMTADERIESRDEDRADAGGGGAAELPARDVGRVLEALAEVILKDLSPGGPGGENAGRSDSSLIGTDARDLFGGEPACAAGAGNWAAGSDGCVFGSGRRRDG